MKYTSEDLMKAMGLQVGDGVFVDNKYKFRITEKFTLFAFMLHPTKSEVVEYPLSHLLGRNFEILPKPKRVGDLKCSGKCSECPLKMLCAISEKILIVDGTLYDILKKETEVLGLFFDQEIYDLLKARLDKEVEEWQG